MLDIGNLWVFSSAPSGLFRITTIASANPVEADEVRALLVASGFATIETRRHSPELVFTVASVAPRDNCSIPDAEEATQ